MAIARRIGAWVGYWTGLGLVVEFGEACVTTVASLTTKRTTSSLTPVRTVLSLTPTRTTERTC